MFLVMVSVLLRMKQKVLLSTKPLRRCLSVPPTEIMKKDSVISAEMVLQDVGCAMAFWL